MSPIEAVRASSVSADVLVVADPRSSAHASPGFHPERPERFAALLRAVGTLGSRAVTVPAPDATDEQLLRVHAAAHVAAIEATRTMPPHFLDADTYVVPASAEAARAGAGGACALVDALIDGRARRAILVPRPPGHHATRDHAMGFCLYNNVAIAAAQARARGLARVAIVDWDVHHGNGTADIFADDPNVLVVSLHEHPLYPATGDAHHVGESRGAGRTVNVPLAAGSDGPRYRSAFAHVVEPVLRAFAPDLILISAGFDAHVRDPLSSMRLVEHDFAWMAARISTIADDVSHGRAGMVVEGGYDLHALEYSAVAAFATFVGSSAPPTLDVPPPDDDLRHVLDVHRRYWPVLTGA